MEATNKEMSIHDRVVAILQGEKPDRIPFIDRMEFWYKNRVREGTMPQEFIGMSESEIHRKIGFGQELWLHPYIYKYFGVEVIAKLDDEIFFHEIDPDLDFFPNAWDLIPQSKIGTTTIEYITPVGKLTVQHEMVKEMILGVLAPTISCLLLGK